jgi:hypothetical protein
MHEDQRVAEARCKLQVMEHGHDRKTVASQALGCVQKGELMLQIEACDGLVEKQHLPGLDRATCLQLGENPGEMYPLPLAAREGLVVALGEVRHICPFKGIEHKALPVATGQSTADPLNPKGGDLKDREGKVEIGGLRHHGPAMSKPPCRDGAQWASAEQNLARCRLKFAAQEAQERRFAGSVGAYHHGE